MAIRDLRGRLTGLSVTAVGGVSWQPLESDRDVVRRLLTYLEDRRVLYVPSECELPNHWVMSVLDIRRYLTELLETTADRPQVADSLRAMRAACRRFVEQAGSIAARHEVNAHVSGTPSWTFNQSLGELRAVMGVHIALLADRYGLSVEDQLAVTLPPVVRDDDAAWLFDQLDS